MEHPKLFTVREAAQYLKIAEWTLRSWISQKRIPYVKLGSRTMFDVDDLNKWIDSHKVAPVELFD
ncbi:MAG: helix-turn-helix domain-containing protein [Anaerolineae bacterium]|nr:helix-turn-helix domain-containing protein [Anaerolineae bacterium]